MTLKAFSPKKMKDAIRSEEADSHLSLANFRAFLNVKSPPAPPKKPHDPGAATHTFLGYRDKG